MAVHSINRISDLDAYINSIGSNVQRVLDGIADVGVSSANAAYNSKLAHRESHDQASAVVAASEGIGFLEFGTGTLVDTGHPYASAVPYDVEPGSWSAEHEQTYQTWVANGRQGTYRYDSRPRRGMYEAGKAMRNDVDNQIRTVFG